MRASTLVAALLVTVASAGGAAASPAAVPVLDSSADARVELIGGALHQFNGREDHVATAEITGELALSPGLSLLGTVPLATVERDGEVAGGWGNLGAGLRLRSVAPGGDARWIRTLTVHVSAPTALDHGTAGLAARSAAAIHNALDLGDYMPATLSSRVTASLRWQGPRWWIAGALVHRIHLFTFDRGETNYWQPLGVTVGVGYRPGRRWAVGAVLDTSCDCLEARYGEGDHFRHLLRVGFERSFAIWQADVALLVPLDDEAREDQSPMISLGLSRAVGG